MNFQNAGHTLFYQTWLTESPKAVFVIAHGLGEHSGRYQQVAESLNAQGYSVYALDHRGHGQSSGAKGHVSSFSDYHSDLNVFIELIKREVSGLPVYLLGHSMGGLIATGYAMRYKNIDKLIISAPAYGVPGKSAQRQLKIGAVIGRFLPNSSLSNKIDPKYVCSTQTVVDAYVADPLVHDTITLGWGRALLEEQHYVRAHLSELTVATLFLIPQADALTDHLVSEKWFTYIGSEQKSIQCYPNAYHEVLNEEVDGPLALQAIIEWVE